MPIQVAVLIPDRGDRPALLRNCMRMLAAQTILPVHVEIVNFPAETTATQPQATQPTNFLKEEPLPSAKPPLGGAQRAGVDVCDITKRYRTGYEKLSKMGFDLIAFIENDDWYSPQYLEYMLTQWELRHRPNMLGTQYTIYYHLLLRSWFTMKHSERSAAMNTFIKPGLDIKWPLDHDPYTDIHLWMKQNLGGALFTPDRHYSIGMKHGTGLCGGNNHTNHLHRYVNKDEDFEWLRGQLDAASFEFYSKYFENQPR